MANHLGHCKSAQALEAFTMFCPSNVVTFKSQLLDISLKYLAYDPNYDGGDADEDMDGVDNDDEDFEDDDVSGWMCFLIYVS